MKALLTGTFLALALSVAGYTVAAQTPPAAGQKPEPKPHDMTGCLAKGDTAGTYKLTNLEKGPKTVDIVEVAKDLKMDAHVGHRITITGVGVPAPKMEGDKKPTGEHYMRVDAMKHVSPTCP